MAKNSTKRNSNTHTQNKKKKRSERGEDGLILMSIFDIICAIGITYFLTRDSVNWVSMTFISFMWMIVLIAVLGAIANK